MKKKLLLLLFVISVVLSQPVRAVDLDYEHGHFKKLRIEPFDSINGTAYKLKDGRVFIRKDLFGSMRIFDPKSNSFVFGERFNPGYAYCSLTLLDNEEVLVTRAYSIYPVFHYTTSVEKLVREEGIKMPYQHIRSWRYELPFEKQEQLYLSYIKKDPKLYEDYKKYAKEYEESIYAQVYNIQTEELRRVGKLNLRRGNFGHVLLKDGTVLFFGGNSNEQSVYVDEQRKKGKNNFDLASQFEIYDPKTETFKLLNTHASLGLINKAFLLNDGRVFIVSSNEWLRGNYPERVTQYFSIYNPETGKVFRSKHHFNGIALVKLPDDRILYTNRIDGLTETNKRGNRDLISGLRIYDPKTDEVVYSGKSLIPRSKGSQLTVLPDGNVMISGGVNYDSCYCSGRYCDPERRVEIFNPSTGEIKRIRPRMHDPYDYDSVLLDDGRILFYDDYDAELYIPKGYEDNKNVS